MTRPAATRTDKDGRVCITCLVYKPWSQFQKNGANGRKPHCKDCDKLKRAGADLAGPGTCGCTCSNCSGCLGA